MIFMEYRTPLSESDLSRRDHCKQSSLPDLSRVPKLKFHERFPRSGNSVQIQPQNAYPPCKSFGCSPETPNLHRNKCVFSHSEKSTLNPKLTLDLIRGVFGQLFRLHAPDDSQDVPVFPLKLLHLLRSDCRATRLRARGRVRGHAERSERSERSIVSPVITVVGSSDWGGDELCFIDS